jgi:hypothetical protein
MLFAFSAIQRKLMLTKKLSDALAAVGRFMHPRSPLDLYKRVELHRVANGMTVSANTATGGCSIFIECDDGVNAIVTHNTLSGIIRSLRSEECRMHSVDNNLEIYTDIGRVRVPDYDIQFPSVQLLEGDEFDVSSEELRRCSRQLRPLSDSQEVRYSRSQRITCGDGLLRLTSCNSRAWGSSWTLCDGGEMDKMVPIQSMLAAVECLDGPFATLITQPGGVGIVSGNSVMLLPLDNQGAPPRSFAAAESIWENGNEWLLSRGSIREFLAQVNVFSTVEATGMWMIPTEDGVLCRYTGRVDGTHSADMAVDGYCDAIIEGTCSGPPVYVSSKALSGAVDAASDDGFRMKVTDSGMFVMSDGFVYGLGLLSHPHEIGA